MNLTKKIAAAAALAAVSASSMAAGLTDAIDAAATSAKADIGTAGATIIGVVVAIAVVGWVRRVIK